MSGWGGSPGSSVITSCEREAGGPTALAVPWGMQRLWELQGGRKAPPTEPPEEPALRHLDFRTSGPRPRESIDVSSRPPSLGSLWQQARGTSTAGRSLLPPTRHACGSPSHSFPGQPPSTPVVSRGLGGGLSEVLPRSSVHSAPGRMAFGGGTRAA